MSRPKRFPGWVSPAVIVAAVLLSFGVTFASVEPPDYPQDKCVFLQTIPVNEAIDPNSDALLQDLVAQTGVYFRLNIGSWTQSVYRVNGSNYQLEDVYLSEAWYATGYWLRDVPFPTDQALKVTTDTDANFSIIDPVHGIEYNLWAPLYNADTFELERNAGGYYEARNGGMVFINTSGSTPVGGAHRGCGIALSLGLVYPGELAAGTINHALPYSFTDPAAEPCPPAAKSDGNNFGDVDYPNRLPESAVFRLKPSVWTDQAIESSGWNHTEKTIAYAARDYGLYVTDNAGNHHIQANHWRVYGSDPYLAIPGCELENREGSGDVVKLWRQYDHFLNPDNFEVLDRVTFPYPEGHQELDYDNDGITNVAETAWGYRDNTYYAQHEDPSNGPLDWDNDGLTNAQECQLRNYFRYLPLNPFDADSDGDGYTDSEEAFNWSADPTNPYVVPDPSWPGMPCGTNLARGKSATSTFGSGSLAVDGDESTFCGGTALTGDVTVDLGASYDIKRVVLKWLYRKYYGVEYTVQVSPNGSTWNTVYTETAGNGGVDDIWGLNTNGRYVKVNVAGAGSPWALYLHEVEVYGPQATQAPVADFYGTPTSGLVPLTVSFVDLSTNSPTSWSWTFGDGGTSVAKHPSHNYTSADSYTVSLTATNAYGSDTETKTGYITAVEGQDYVCNSMTVDTGTVQSGDHNSVHSSDNVYLVLQAARVSGTYRTQVSYTYNTGLGSVFLLRVTVESKASISTTQPERRVYLYNYSTQAWDQQNSTLLATIDTTTQVDVANPSNYISGGGTVQVQLWTGGSKTAYSHSTDLVKITAAAPGGNPPVADFTGNPTSGTAPLTVYFTDTSTNSPTSWSWTFGDGGSSEAQNPSHIYTSAGSKTVSLTATNQYGSDTETKTNYITVVQAQDYFCTSATVDTGTLQSGDHTSVHASDNVYLVVRSAKVTGKQRTQVTYNYSTGLGGLSYLRFTVEGKVSAGSQPQTVYVYNYSTSTWDSKSSSTLSTTDSTVDVEVANPANYISGGTVQVRVYTGGTGSTTYDHSTDLVRITAAP